MADNHGRDDYARAYWRERFAELRRYTESQPEELPVASAKSIRPSEHPTKKGIHVIRRLFPELK
jgi:hypothetical protein